MCISILLQLLVALESAEALEYMSREGLSKGVPSAWSWGSHHPCSLQTFQCGCFKVTNASAHNPLPIALWVIGSVVSQGKLWRTGTLVCGWVDIVYISTREGSLATISVSNLGRRRLIWLVSYSVIQGKLRQELKTGTWSSNYRGILLSGLLSTFLIYPRATWTLHLLAIKKMPYI